MITWTINILWILLGKNYTYSKVQKIDINLHIALAIKSSELFEKLLEKLDVGDNVLAAHGLSDAVHGQRRYAKVDSAQADARG